MISVSYSKLRDKLKYYCDLAADKEELIIVTRQHGQDVVMLSLDQYDKLTKWSRDAAYVMRLEELSGRFQKSEEES